MSERIGVLFIQSQRAFGADSAIHAELMRHLDRGSFAVHAACAVEGRDDPNSSYTRLSSIAELAVRSMRFVPSVSKSSIRGIAAGLPATGAAAGAFLELANYVRRKRIRVIHGSDRPRDALYTVALGKVTGARSVVHVHVKWSNQYSLPSRWGVRNADAVFGISRYVTETVVATGKPRDRVHTVLNAIDPGRFDPETSGSSVRREFSIPDDAPVLASVSRLFSWKGQRELLRAFASVRAEVPNVRLFIVGADEHHIHGESYSDELKKLARELGVGEAVVFTGPRSDVPAIMAACDVFTLPSFEEPFGLVFLEAMAMQRPVVALSNGGTPEVVEHGRTGLLSEPNDIDGLASNVVSLLRDPERRASMGRLGRARVLENFNPKRMAGDVAIAYRTILG